jgi:hypothetical protein
VNKSPKTVGGWQQKAASDSVVVELQSLMVRCTSFPNGIIFVSHKGTKFTKESKKPIVPLCAL